MYIPKLYREEDHQKILAFLKQNNFPAILSYGDGKPIATHAVVEVIEDENGKLTIYGHMARPNPQWKTFNDQEILLIFQGAHTYISPRWYNHVNVPTWNYTIVHVYGHAHIMQGNELFESLRRLIHNQEEYTQYRLENLPQDFVQKQMKGIVGIAVEVTSLEAGYKLSQNRSDEDYENIVRELDKRGDEVSAEIARAMREKREEPRRKERNQ